MYTPIYTKQFEKDLRLCQRRGKNLEKFKIVALTKALSYAKATARHAEFSEFCPRIYAKGYGYSGIHPPIAAISI